MELETEPMVLGRKVSVPVQIRSVSAFSATFLVKRGAAQKLVAPSGLSVLSVLPGLSCVSIAALDYRDGDWGAYRELAVVFPVAPPRPSQTRVALYMHMLPVTEAFTCAAGIELYGFPKWLAEIELSQRARESSCAFRSDGKHVLSLEVRGAGNLTFGPAAIDAYSTRAGKLRRCRFSMQGSGLGVRPGGAKLILGQHPIADELRALGLPSRALMTTTIANMQAEFGAPETVSSVSP